MAPKAPPFFPGLSRVDWNSPFHDFGHSRRAVEVLYTGIAWRTSCENFDGLSRSWSARRGSSCMPACPVDFRVARNDRSLFSMGLSYIMPTRAGPWLFVARAVRVFPRIAPSPRLLSVHSGCWPRRAALAGWAPFFKVHVKASFSSPDIRRSVHAAS